MSSVRTTKNTYQQFITIEPLLHVFIWSMVFLYPYIKYAGREGGYMMSFLHEVNALIFKMTISYLLYFWYFSIKNKLKNVPILLFFLVSNIMLYEFFDNFFHPQHTDFWVHFFTNLLTYISFGVVFYAIYSVKNNYKKQVAFEVLSKEKQQAELMALKAQINPHFLFNTLNTIYANALRKDDNTPELLLKLSDSFRYVLHKSQHDLVTLREEIQHIRDYIHLQEERLSNKVVVQFSSDLDQEELEIAPLLLIGFIENAFKYASVLKGSNHIIKIHIELNTNNLLFTCENPYAKIANNIDETWKKSGVGIESTQKRLQLLYPEKHELQIQTENNQYKVLLKIEL